MPPQLTPGQIVDVVQRYEVRSLHAPSPCTIDICHFQIPLALIAVPDDNSHADRCDNRGQLPSSLEQRTSAALDWKSSAPKTTASVSYTLNADLWRGNVLLVSHSRKVRIFNCSEIAPPLCLGDFGKEYSNCQEIVMRKNLIQKIGKMSIKATQPDALIFSGPDASATTKVLLQLRLQTIYDPGEGCEPGAFEAAIKWTLRSSTFVCMHMQAATPTIGQLTRSPSMGCIKSTCATHRLKMLWSDWRPNSADPDSREWTATYPLWLSIKSSPALPPTFLLPYLSRRYTIAIEISISGQWHSKSTLTLPVQVTYQSKANPSQCLLQSSRSCTTEGPVGGVALPASSNGQELPPYLA